MKYPLVPNIPLPNGLLRVFINSAFGKSRFVYYSETASALLYFKIRIPADTLVSLSKLRICGHVWTGPKKGEE